MPVDRTRGLVEDFLATLPCTTFAFSYGSAVFSHGSSDANQIGPPPMLDVILFVHDAEEWHSEVSNIATPLPLSQPRRYPV
jgi:Phosphatidate cytidylyltransferase, mitochondrial